jgi:ribosomal protein L33
MCCPKCGNKVLYDESYYIGRKPIIVIGCVICGNREYPSDKAIKDIQEGI